MRQKTKLWKMLACTAAAALVLTACSEMPMGPGDIPGGTSGGSTSASSTTTDSQLDEYRQEVLRLVNAERAKVGAAPLTMNSNLNAAAQVRAEELTVYFSHTRPDGSDCFTVFDDYGLSYWLAGENIAAGQGSPASVVNSWMNSPGHRANILNSAYTEIGIGFAKTSSGYGYYWVQDFIG